MQCVYLVFFDEGEKSFGNPILDLLASSAARLESTVLRAVGLSELCESCLAMTVAGMAPSRRSLLLLLLHSSSEESFLSFAQTKVQIVEGTKDYLRAKNESKKKIFFVPPEEFDFSPEFFIPRHGFSGVDYGSYEQQEKPAKVVGEVVLCVLPRVEVRTLCLFFGWMCPRSMNYWVRRDLRFVVLLRLIPKFITFRLHCFTGAQRKEPGYLMWGGGW